jgi:uncharacterized membrane protein YfcA
MADVSLLTLGGLFLLAVVAGTIDAMAGGGGLLTVPGLMATGIEPVSVFATNKLQGTFSSLSAMIHFWRKGQIKLRDHLWPASAAFMGSVAGAVCVSYSNPQFLKSFVPFLLIAIALWVLLSPKLGQVERKSRISPLTSYLTLIPVVGFYDGYFGPGAGTFYAFGLVSLMGLTLHEATMRAKIYNLGSNLGALMFFLFTGHIHWLYGAVMIVGMFIGGNMGARLILKHGTNLIKPVLVAVSLTMSAKLLWQQNIIQSWFGLSG